MAIAIFVLLLNNHRLLYVKEVPGAPDLTSFKATCLNFIKYKRLTFIDQLYKEKNEKAKLLGEKRITKKQLYKDYPPPQLRITPLMGSQALKDFIQNFQKIDTLKIDLLPTNSENINNDEFWSALGDTRRRMESQKASVNFNNKREGLNSEEVYEQCSSAGSMANSRIRLSGNDEFGGTLRGNNEDFSLTVEYDDLPKKVDMAGYGLVRKFNELVEVGTIQLPQIPKTIADQIKNISSLFFS